MGSFADSSSFWRKFVSGWPKLKESLQENIDIVTTIGTMVGSCKDVIVTSNRFAINMQLCVMSCTLVAILRIKHVVTLLQLNYVVTISNKKSNICVTKIYSLKWIAINQSLI